MLVNSARKSIAFVAIVVFLIASSFTAHPDRDLWAKEVNLMIRQIGHKLLLQAGDSTSSVSPVTEIRKGTFQLRFNQKLFFNHDSLITLSDNSLPRTYFPSGYTLTVHEGMKPDIVYGFQVNNASGDIIACRGRSQPLGSYRIEIAFPDLNDKIDQKEEPKSINLVFSGMLILLGVTLLIGSLRKTSKPAPVKNQVFIGKFSFDVKDQRLLLGDEVISLTDKECKVLEMLNSNFGELILRETLMQNIWINEGVITGRSLDMFVSKLRKKLSGDPELRITNVHGKGYKLELVEAGKPDEV